MTTANAEDVQPLGEGKTLPLRFRNYTPMDEELRAASSRSEVQLEDDGDSTKLPLSKASAKVLLQDSEKLVRDLEEKVHAVIARVDVVKVAPQKVNWDLKRDVAKRLKRLARTTQRAVLNLAEQERKRRKLEEEEASDTGSGSGSQSDLSSTSNSAASDSDS